MHILNISGDKHALAEDLRALLPNKRITVRRDRVEIHKASYDVGRVCVHFLDRDATQAFSSRPKRLTTSPKLVSMFIGACVDPLKYFQCCELKVYESNVSS